MAGTVRTTISVPTELKAQMDALEESVNWSAVACQAFEAKVAEVITRRKAKDMNETITRLRASQRKHADEQYRSGYTDGERWAKDEAEAPELERLLSCRRMGTAQDWASYFADDETSAYSPGERIYFTIAPDEDKNRDAAAEFWEHVSGSRGALMGDGSYVRGFWEGALDVWVKIKDKL